jgi:small subunit ribosomal protein S18
MPPRKQRNSKPHEQRHCPFCVHNVKAIDYKDMNMLRRYTSSYGKIVPKRRSGVCSAHQRPLAMAIKNARIMALLPFAVR